MSDFAVGDHVVWKGQGLARIDRVADGMLELEILGNGIQIAVTAANAARAIRRPVDRATAARLWATLESPGEADARSWDDRYFDAMRTLVKGTVEDQVARLRTMYSSRFAPTVGERRLIDAYEQLLLSELGHVLGRTVDELAAAVRARQPTFAATAAPRPREPRRPEPKPQGPTVRGFELLGPFAVEGGLVVAEPTQLASDADGRSVRVAATPGAWYAYSAVDEDTERTGVLVAVHADALAAAKNRLATLEKRARVVGKVRVDGGQLAIVDQAVRAEERFEDELCFRTRHGTVLGRGCTSESGMGDGTYPVSVVADGDRAVFVLVDFR